MREYKGLITPLEKGLTGQCGYCRKHGAKFIDISFGCWICDIRCANKMWKDYVEAERRTIQ